MDLNDIKRMLAEREADVEALRRVAKMLSEPQGEVVAPKPSTPPSSVTALSDIFGDVPESSKPAEKESAGALVRKAIQMLPSGDFTVTEVRLKLATFVSPERLEKIQGPVLSTETSRLAKKGGVITLKAKGTGSPSIYHKP